MQKGQLIEASGSIYIRFYRDGKRVAERLCKIDDVHYGTKSKAVKRLRDEFILRESAPTAPASQLTVAEFWNDHYLPWAESVVELRLRGESDFALVQMERLLSNSPSKYVN
jgi:hypothetical protein